MPPEAAPPAFAPMLMLSAAGIQRDGTRASQSQYSEGRWTRFYQGLPRKMMGYREQRRDVGGIVRAMDVQSYDGYSYVHLGLQERLQRYTININSGLTSGLIDRTPVGFNASPDNNWQFSIMYNTANDSNLIFAHAAPNIRDISSTIQRPIYFSEVRETDPLLELTPTAPTDHAEVSGGVVSIWPYLVRYGNDGFVGWSPPGEPVATSGTGSGTARPCGTKIVRGLPLRGTSGPACLLWALDALVRMQWVGGSQIFQFDTVTTSSAILSTNGIIEHEGVYFWPTVSGWAQFNGVMRRLKNDNNEQFFLDNLNWDMRQKVFAFKVPRWNEIWWCAPLFGATECNWAFVFNHSENTWYDTPLPIEGRTSGVYEQIYHFPLLSSAVVNPDTGGTSMWQHEFGFNDISGVQPISKAILASISTAEFSVVIPKQQGQQGVDRNMSFNLLEPDFDQRGDLTFRVYSRMNARAPIRLKTEKVIPAIVDETQEELVKFKMTGRLTTFEIVSNTLDGNFVFGAPVIHWVPSDGRRED